jgi:1-acyl-sn-glycerol-3-phosphate acyltransferase
VTDDVVARAGTRRRALFFDLVAVGLGAWARRAFRVEAVGAERFALEPGTLLVCNHASDADVPVLVAALYRHGYRPGRRKLLVHFSMRHDLHLRGFFGGYPTGISPRVRRLLFRIGIAPVLDWGLPTPPLRPATRMRAVELVREHPEEPLRDLVGEPLLQQFRLRAERLGRTPPVLARDANRGVYADLLWREVTPEETTGEAAAGSWQRRAAAAGADFRRFVGIVREGGVLLLFPEGTPSPDGSLQPLRRGVGALVRRASPRVLLPLALAYDPLTGGRPYAYVGVGAAIEPPRREVEQAVAALLARTVPLAVGQVVADALERGDRAGLAERLEREVAEAVAAGRPVPAALLDPLERSRMLEDAVAAAAAHPERLPRLLMTYRSTRS